MRGPSNPVRRWFFGSAASGGETPVKPDSKAHMANKNGNYTSGGWHGHTTLAVARALDDMPLKGSGLTRAAFDVLGALVRHMKDERTGYECNASMPILELWTKRSRNPVREALELLECVGAIRGDRGLGKGNSSRYRVNCDWILKGGDSHPFEQTQKGQKLTLLEDQKGENLTAKGGVSDSKRGSFSPPINIKNIKNKTLPSGEYSPPCGETHAEGAGSASRSVGKTTRIGDETDGVSQNPDLRKPLKKLSQLTASDLEEMTHSEFEEVCRRRNGSEKIVEKKGYIGNTEWQRDLGKLINAEKLRRKAVREKQDEAQRLSDHLNALLNDRDKLMGQEMDDSTRAPLLAHINGDIQECLRELHSIKPQSAQRGKPSPTIHLQGVRR